MRLFDDVTRTDAQPKRHGEPLFGFYNRTSRSEFEVGRHVMQTWTGEMPPGAAAELVQQMRGGGDLGYATGLAELVTHALLVRLGFKVEVHPRLDGNKNRPDFLATDQDGTPIAYVEVTTMNPPTEDVADDLREAAIHDRLNRAKLPPDLRLGYFVETRGGATPPIRKLASEIEAWASANAECARQSKYVEHVFETAGWAIRVRLIGGFKANPDARSIAISGMRVFSMEAEAPSKALRAALDRKATRYGVLGTPFVLVVVDRTKRLAYVSAEFAESVAGGLFGPEIVEDVECSDGRTELRRRRGDGFWVWKGKPDHTGVSAALVFPREDIWHHRDPKWQPLLVRNPYASIPMPDFVLPFGELMMSDKEGAVILGRLAADILGLPELWPPE